MRGAACLFSILLVGCAEITKLGAGEPSAGILHSPVCVHLTVLTDGSIRSPRLLKSSGNAEIDARILYNTRDWSFRPAMQGSAPVEKSVIIAVQRFSTLRNPLSGTPYSEEQAKEYCRSQRSTTAIGQSGADDAAAVIAVDFRLDEFRNNRQMDRFWSDRRLGR